MMQFNTIQRTMSQRTCLLLVLLMSICHLHTINAAEEKQYEIGEKITQGELKTDLESRYTPLAWESLSPADWDPLEPLKGLDLETLDDADPAAIEALTAVGDAWKRAPIVPSLNGKHVQLSGFVVPLDINKQKVKELLLVPYFGACIHIPPPPSNQTIHALNASIDDKAQNQILKSAALVQGPIVLMGVLEASATNTHMGEAGYKLHIEHIQAYKE